MMARWYCRRMARGEVNQDPVHEEFFTPREERAEGLVRESIQNTLDAAANGHVRMRYTFSDAPLPVEKASEYLGGLRPHVEAVLGAMPVFDEPMPFIVVEDFGTRGLSGDPAQDRDIAGQAKRNDFYYFWRNVGRSSKGETDRGRWGLGKIVYPATSKVCSFLGLTVRAEDGRRLLMGQAVLKVHESNAARFCPYPYFGIAGADDFCTPVEDANELEAFTADFQLERRTEPGLSIVIPHARVDEVGPDDVLRSTIRNYFFPILAGTLTVEVKRGAKLTTLTSGTIRAVTAALDWTGASIRRDELESLFDLSEWAIGLDAAKHVQLAEQGGGAPAWGDQMFVGQDLSALRDRFDAGDRLGFRVPVKTHRKGGAASTSWFKVFVMKDSMVSRAEEHYIRQGITISDIRRVRESQVRGLVVIDDPALSALLGDSEGPAHTDWSERESKLKERYQHGASCVRFVKNSLRELVGLLSRPPEGMDQDLLSDVFYVENPVAGGALPGGKGKTPAPPGPTPPGPTPPPRQPQALRVDRTEGGFRVAGRPELRGGVTIEMAYEVRKGNAFKRYDQNDFDVGKAPIAVVVSGGRITHQERNRIEAVVEAEPFEIRVTGFDSKRDLAVRARHLDEIDGAAGEAA